MKLAGWRGVVLALAFGLSMHAPAASGADLPASAAAERAFTRAAPRPAWADVLPVQRAAQAHGPFSILLSDLQIRLDDSQAASQSIYGRSVIEVHSAAALADVGRIDIDFLPDFQTLELHGVSVIRDGQRLDRLAGAQVRFLQREAGLDQGVYSGAVTANIVVADLRVGDLLDVEYTVRGANPVMKGKLFYSAAWDSNVQVGRRRVVLDTLDSRRVGARLVGSDNRPAPTPRSERRDGRTRLTYEASGQQAYLAENHVPPEAHAYRWLQFSEMADWSEVNRWAVELFPRAAGGPAVEALVKRLRAAGTPEQQAVKALEFVQQEVRYLSLSIGENSHRPALPEDVLQRRYGDCKDKSLLLGTLLQRLGIEAHVALLRTDMPAGLDQLLPSPQLFDHAVVHATVGGRAWLLDPTRQGQHGSLAKMGNPYGAHQVLLARPGQDKLVQVGATPAALPLSRRVELFELDKPGEAAQLTVTHELSGGAAEAMRTWLASATAEQHLKNLAGAMAARYPDAEPLGGLDVQDDHAANLVRVVSRFRIGALFARVDGGWRMQYRAANLADVFNKSDTPTRRYQLAATELLPGEAVEYEMQLRFRNMPELQPNSGAVKIDDPAFAYSSQGEVAGLRTTVRMRLRAAAAQVEPQRLAEYTRNLARLEDHIDGWYALADPVPAPQPVTQAPPAPPTPAEVLSARLVRLNDAVHNAGFRAVDPSAALCERARVHQALGQGEEALKDVQQALRLQPKAPAMLVCGADIHFAAGRFAAAEAAYAHAAALGAHSVGLYLGRGANAVYLGQNEHAAVQFRQMLALADNDAARLRAHIWLALVKAAPGKDDAPVQAQAGERWLALILQAVQGGVRPEQAIAAATGDGGPAGLAQLGETYYYLGRMLLTKGERWRALAYFRQAMAKLPPDHPYHATAAIDARRLQEKTP